PDAVEHHDVESGAPTLEVDDVELVLIVGRPWQRLTLHAHPRVRCLELAQEPWQRIAVTEDARVLEYERNGAALLPRGAAAGRQKTEQREEREGRAIRDRAHAARSRVRSRASPRSGIPSQAGRLSSS